MRLPGERQRPHARPNSKREKQRSLPRNNCRIEKFIYLCRRNGVLAQLVERLNGIQKVRGPIPLCSTKKVIDVSLWPFLFRLGRMLADFRPHSKGGYAVRSLLATCKAHGVDERTWLEDVLRKMPEYERGQKDFADLLPGNWAATRTK